MKRSVLKKEEDLLYSEPYKSIIYLLLNAPDFHHDFKYGLETREIRFVIIKKYDPKRNISEDRMLNLRKMKTWFKKNPEMGVNVDQELLNDRNQRTNAILSKLRDFGWIEKRDEKWIYSYKHNLSPIKSDHIEFIQTRSAQNIVALHGITLYLNGLTLKDIGDEKEDLHDLMEMVPQLQNKIGQITNKIAKRKISKIWLKFENKLPDDFSKLYFRLFMIAHLASERFNGKLFNYDSFRIENELYLQEIFHNTFFKYLKGKNPINNINSIYYTIDCFYNAYLTAESEVEIVLRNASEFVFVTEAWHPFTSKGLPLSKLTFNTNINNNIKVGHFPFYVRYSKDKKSINFNFDEALKRWFNAIHSSKEAKCIHEHDKKRKLSNDFLKESNKEDIGHDIFSEKRFNNILSNEIIKENKYDRDMIFEWLDQIIQLLPSNFAVIPK